MKQLFFIVSILLLFSACKTQVAEPSKEEQAVVQFTGEKVPDEVPYGVAPATPAKEALDQIATFLFDSLTVTMDKSDKMKSIRIYSDENGLYNGWAVKVFSDTEHKYRYTKFEEGLSIWQIGYFDNGDLGHDFHMKDGKNYGSQRMWRKGGGLYIDTYFLEGGVLHGPQLRWHGNGTLSRDALFDKGQMVYEILFDQQGQPTKKEGKLPDKYQ